jgi:acetyltransferase-like isoleucine patch superfamily enzyme
MSTARTLSWDWFPGSIPENVVVDETAYIETTFSFQMFRSRRERAIEYGKGASSYLGTMFDVGPRGRVKLGDFALVHGARIICDTEVLIGDYALISWNVVLMDTYRLPVSAKLRRPEMERLAAKGWCATESVASSPICLERNVWIGFDTCILPGVTIGEGSIVGAKSVVKESVPPFTIVGGNPARVLRTMSPAEREAHVE